MKWLTDWFMETYVPECLILALTLLWCVDRVHDAWTFAATSEVHRTEIQIDYDRELRSGSLERLRRPQKISEEDLPWLIR